MRCSALVLHCGPGEDLDSSGHEASKTLMGEGTLTIQKLVAIQMWEAPAS